MDYRIKVHGPIIDLHTHSILSDGELIPSELVRRAEVAGCIAIAITDHVDRSNIHQVVPSIVKFSDELCRFTNIYVIPGMEITHAPINDIAELCRMGRDLGAEIVLVHGETIVEPVPPGTNRKALEAGIDILAHPGLISEEEVLLAKEMGVFLEITTRKGHSLTNGHVAKLAIRLGANLVINTDTHSPEDILKKEERIKIAMGAGLSSDQVSTAFQNSLRILERIKGKRG